MSDYYQQEVTKYMMRRTKRKAAERSEDEARTPVADGPKQGGGWLASLHNWLADRRSGAEIEPAISEKTPRPVR